VDENLTEDERKDAWKEFEDEKNGIFKNMGDPNFAFLQNLNYNPEDVYVRSSTNRYILIIWLMKSYFFLQNMYRANFPHLSHDQILNSTHAYVLQVQSGITRKPAYDKSHYKQAKPK